MGRVRVTLRHSPIGRPDRQRRILKSLGLRRLNQSREFEDSPSLRGKVFHLSHLLELTEVDPGTEPSEMTS